VFMNWNPGGVDPLFSSTAVITEDHRNVAYWYLTNKIKY
jgi:hypothetical protein